MGVLTAGTLLEIYRIRAGYAKNLSKVAGQIEQVEYAQTLPRLKDM
jgi:hypothetical protein